MTILYACFNETNDKYIHIGTFTSDWDATTAGCEHGLSADTEWYVNRAVPVLIKGKLTYEPEPSVGVCIKCGRDLYLNDWDLDGVCIDCTHDGSDPNCDHSCGYELDHSDSTRFCYNCGEPHPDNPMVGRMPNGACPPMNIYDKEK